MLVPSSTLPPITYDVYQADYLSLGRQYDRGDARMVMSNSELKRFAQCPSRWRRGTARKSSDSLEWGTLVDCLVLTPDRFEEQFVICPETYPEKGMKCPSCGSITTSSKCSKCKVQREEITTEKPWNRNATYCEEWEAEQQARGKNVVKSDWASEGHAAKARIMSDAQLREFITSSHSQVQLCVEWRDPQTGIVVPIKCLLDLVPAADSKFRLMLGDLKTAASGYPGAWVKQVYAEGYHMQAALYLDAYNAVTGEKRNVFVHAVQENFAPYETARRMLSEEYLQLGRAAYQRALVDYCYCLKNDEWPGLDEADGFGDIIDGWRLTEPLPHMILG